MNKLTWLGVVALTFGIGLLLATAPVSAHHAFAAEFDANQPLTLKGTIVKMEWVNPHGWLHIDVKDPAGKVVTWALEFGSPNSLLKRGLRKENLPIGAEVTVSAYRAKNGSSTAHAEKVTMADGKALFTGSSGTGAPYEQ